MKLSTLLLFFISFLLPFSLRATHIVGGDLQLRHIEDNTFRLILNLYFDEINGNPLAEDEEVRVNMFSKSDDNFVTSFILPLSSKEDLAYSNIACQITQLSTNFLEYSAEIPLPPDIYNDVEGYYFVWERCCRNATINNIISPDNSGMVFYLEVPAVALQNSSPIFSTPKGDYACLNQFFTFDFSARDPDGDQLVYSLITPLAGNSSQDNPTVPPFERPYSEILWRNTFSENNAILGNPSLQINSQTGILTVAPSLLGLFVFAVKCEEFRDGQKIGESRRDFQLMVIDCPSNEAPEISLFDEQGQVYQEGQTLTIVADKGFCLPIQVRDTDLNENVRVLIRPLNFSKNNTFIENPEGVIFQSNSSFNTTFCWDECTFSESENEEFLLEIIAQDDACPLPKADTLLLRLVVLPESNNPPTISTTLQENEVIFEVESNFSFLVKGIDLDNDSVRVFAEGVGFDLENFGMAFEESKGIGEIQSTFTWQSDCGAVRDFITPYQVNFIVQDRSHCFRTTDTLQVTLLLKDKDFEESQFLPANVFTPNNDGKNDVFKIPEFPPETCLFGFEKIEIYNHWGVNIFESKDKNFAWSGENFPTGVYFYYIDFRNKSYKGYIQILR